MTDQQLNAGHKTLSRRTMLKTAVWSAPVIAVAIAAPAAAASGGDAVMTYTNNTLAVLAYYDPVKAFKGLQGNFKLLKSEVPATAIVSTNKHT